MERQENRKLLKCALKETHERGRRLVYVEASEKDIDRWMARTHKLIKEALGEYKARHFFADEEGRPVAQSQRQGPAWLEGRLSRLQEIIEMVDSLEDLDLQPGFIGQDWVSKK